MWTPKRIVLLAIGFVLFVTSYFCYAASFFGAIDGLPTLPEGYYRPAGDGGTLPPPPRRGRRVEQKLKQAFGLDCPELDRVIKLELHSRSMVLASNDFKLDPENGRRVILSPISVAVFAKPKKPGDLPEINTIRGRVAYLTLDRPVENLTEVSGRKVVGAELRSHIEIVHNRKTPERTDDLSVYIGTGPLYYDAEKKLITTNDTVHLKDLSSQPNPNEIWGKGMELELATKQEKKPGTKEQETISGAKRVELFSNVVMYFYVDKKDGFLHAGQESPKQAKNNVEKKENGPKSQVVIKTPGRFKYLIGKTHDTATFAVPPGSNEAIEHVYVQRHDPTLNANDFLMCQKLEIRLEGKSDPKADPQKTKTGAKQDLSIQYARATGSHVTLTADVEKLEARGVEFIYDAKKLLTILRGGSQPMEAVKDNHVIHAKELTIQERKDPSDPQGIKTYHETLAQGPGQIDIYDKKTDTNTMHAYWTHKLIATRDGPNDLLVLTGAARFHDEENNQTLQAEVLKVWLEPKDDKKSPLVEAVPEGSESKRASRLHHVEAIGNVVARSPELNIDNTSRLMVWFKDDPNLSKPKPATTLAQGPANPPAPPTPNHQTSKPTPKQPNTSPAPKKEDPKEPPRPIHLSARSVEAWVLRGLEKNTLEKLWTEGGVHVHQAPKVKGEKGVDIQGDSLRMDYHPDGNYLVVMGDLAQMRLEKLFILGPEVHIDQRANKAWVTGAGAMQMDSATTLSGETLAKPIPMTIHWQRSMIFDGQSADFIGSIQAEQKTSRLACHHLQVFFDKSISLKEGNKKGESARIKHLVCHKDVRLQQTEMVKNELQRYQRLEAHSVSLNTLESDEEPSRDPNVKPRSDNEVRASGPGRLRNYALGDDQPMVASQPGTQPKPTDKKKQTKEMKLTYVEFSKNMYANSLTNKARFYGDVKVLNLPSNDPHMEIDLSELVSDLPEGAMYLSSAMLTVVDRGEPGKTKQEMLAQGRVIVRAKKYWGRAATVHFNEEKDQIIFDGGDSLATLYKVVPKGAKAQEIKGKKITYLRSTGAFKIDDGRWIFGN